MVNIINKNDGSHVSIRVTKNFVQGVVDPVKITSHLRKLE